MNMNADSDFSHVQTRMTANSCVILVYLGSLVLGLLAENSDSHA